MPIDTTQKLVSALWKALPIPSDGIIDDFDMPHAVWHYAGFTYALPVPIANLIRMVNIQIVTGEFTNVTLE